MQKWTWSVSVVLVALFVLSGCKGKQKPIEPEQTDASLLPMNYKDHNVVLVSFDALQAAHVSALGWVAFDAANRISPDQRYVRLAVGRDYREATPVSGIRLGQATEALAVRITVEQ